MGIPPRCLPPAGARLLHGRRPRPRSANWTTVNATGEQANSASRDIVRTRSRDLERNSDIMGAEILAFERNVVGTGIVLQAKVLGSNGKEDEDLNTQIETLWREWSRPGNARSQGGLAWAKSRQ